MIDLNRNNINIYSFFPSFQSSLCRFHVAPNYSTFFDVLYSLQYKQPYFLPPILNQTFQLPKHHVPSPTYSPPPLVLRVTVLFLLYFHLI